MLGNTLEKFTEGWRWNRLILFFIVAKEHNCVWIVSRNLKCLICFIFREFLCCDQNCCCDSICPKVITIEKRIGKIAFGDLSYHSKGVVGIFMGCF